MNEPLFVQQAGVWVRAGGVRHSPDEYDERALQTLSQMQQRHFWYRGRHRFLLAALRRQLARLGRSPASLCALDLGAGCGGWLHYLAQHLQPGFRELALADSSPRALAFAAELNGPGVQRFQVELGDLGWRDRWDVVFLLDVLEHLDDHETALREVAESLTPGGLLLLTVPALKTFWSFNDDLAQHKRRYAKADLRALAGPAGLTLLEARYFMFFLSPLLLLTRLGRRVPDSLSAEERARIIADTHRVPAAPLNHLLAAIFSAETPLGLWCPFPWGTSLLGIFQKK
jgi:SAM-dependent methyltransferase